MFKVTDVPIQRFWLLEAEPHQSVHRRQTLITLGAIIVLLLIVTWLGARSLNVDALWYDEVWSLYYAGGQEYGPISPAATVNRVVEQLQHEKNPPGYYILLNLWGEAVGWTEYAGRVLSLLAGVLTVACTYRLGYDVGGSLGGRSRRLVGLAAAAAVGGSAFFIYYTHELRTYSLMVLFTVLVLLTYWRTQYGVRRPGVILQMGFVLSIAGALYMHYLTALVIGGVGLYHLFAAPKNGRWVRVASLGVIGGALFLPWLPPLIEGITEAQALQSVAMQTPDMLRELLVVFSNVNLALFILCVVFALRAHGQGAGFAWFVAGAGIGVAAVLNTIYPLVTHVRYLIALWPALALVVGLGVERLGKRGIPPIVILGIWVGAGVWNTVDPNFNRVLNGATLPWREFRAELAEHGEPDDVVIFHAPDYNWYRDLEMQHYMDGLPMRYSLTENIPGLQEHGEYIRNATTFVSDAPRVWVGVDQILPPNFRLGEFQRILDRAYVSCYSVFDVPDMRFDLYVHRPDAAETMPFQFGDGIRATLLEPIRDLDDGQISVLVGWQVDASVPPDTYSTGLHLIDASGNLAGQVDMGLPGQGYHCQQATFRVSAGDYTLYGLVYNWQTGERLPGVDAETGDTGDRLAIRTVEVGES